MESKKLNRFVGVILTEDLYSDLKDLTIKLNVPVSAYIRGLVAEKLNERTIDQAEAADGIMEG